MREHGFIRPEFEVRYLVAERIEDVIPMLQTAFERRPIERARLDPRFLVARIYVAPDFISL